MSAAVVMRTSVEQRRRRRDGSCLSRPIEIVDHDDNDNDDDEHDGPLLSALVDIDSDDTNQMISLTREQERVILSMTKMRSNLERYVQQEVAKISTTTTSSSSTHSRKRRRRDSSSSSSNDNNHHHQQQHRECLFRSIKTLQATGKYHVNFVDAMHTLRDYGNAAVHCRYQDLPSYQECTEAVKKYLLYKNLHVRVHG